MHIHDVPVRPTPDQLRRLRAHRPYALALLSRLQVAAGAFDGLGGAADNHGAGTSPYAHVLFVEEGTTETGTETRTACDPPFAAAFVDLSKAPETAAWLYATDQDGSLHPPDDATPTAWVVDRGAALVADWAPARRAQLAEAAASATTAAAAAQVTTHVKVNIHDGVRYLLQHPEAVEGVGRTDTDGDGRDAVTVTTTYWDAYDKWLFRIKDLPVLSNLTDTAVDIAPAATATAAPPPLSTLYWDVVRPGDVALVMARTSIPRSAATLLSLPSVALRDGSGGGGRGEHQHNINGTLQAWAFLGVDGSLWSLHCEPAYRGRGLAKTLAARLLRTYSGVFDDDDDDNDDGGGWCAADVSALNRQSQGVCRSLGGVRTWSTAWVIIQYDSLGDDE
ncbi:gcn5-related n-acetyltransferase [Niveomyces insectorum RCEF 264]|uniref:Gcn5-related n-acetyltransferase n=1 Tax=Niveomyces insectorum RCEF 264 TaxID=1081102 RepID=A0A167U4F5_9HYPO|nr:gcn5-related n-acetyltransferase [Niveomyces insectorum RCEF 264]